LWRGLHRGGFGDDQHPQGGRRRLARFCRLYGHSRGSIRLPASYHGLTPGALWAQSQQHFRTLARYLGLTPRGFTPRRELVRCLFCAFLAASRLCVKLPLVIAGWCGVLNPGIGGPVRRPNQKANTPSKDMIGRTGTVIRPGSLMFPCRSLPRPPFSQSWNLTY
jgi:hypothetical protein